MNDNLHNKLALAEHQITVLQDLVLELDTYIEFLGRDLERIHMFALSHGLVTSDDTIKEGASIRRRIVRLRSYIKEIE